ncbi:senescence-associated protein (macronuclear) [Tetrahymena thermophila SB210]|uniref:Senescence-associated protein n=1 Tax=Tetrahymena thermophila (strain SB210) TaxID=312017 RepID=I7LZR2_TETTS|nr:senescence-associated protein [Tetrahymena thermophila SB210]EAR84658.3 senescence-associated protein [Tetrahymena thermophila SB210]|eukprot:XP_001032321.3 senescence-associated protein [Tetrahymena thermophila SB210]
MEYRMELVFEIADSILYNIQNNSLSIIDQAPLAIYVLRQYNLVVLKLGQWQYSLSQDLPVMFLESCNKKMYAFPSNQGNFGLVLGPYTTQDQEQILESIFTQCSDFVIATPQEENQNINNINQDYQQQQQQPLSTSKWIQGYLQKGGDMIRTGIILGGNAIAYGIKIGGRLIKSTFSKPEVKEIDPQTLQKVQMAHATSDYILTYTQQQLEYILDNAKSIGQEIFSQVAQSQTGQQIQQHKNYADIRNVTKGTINAVASIYDGLFESLATIARGFQSTTTSVVNAKYGQQAGLLVDHSMDTVANIGNIFYQVNQQASKAVQEASQSQIRNF